MDAAKDAAKKHGPAAEAGLTVDDYDGGANGDATGHTAAGVRWARAALPPQDEAPQRAGGSWAQLVRQASSSTLPNSGSRDWVQSRLHFQGE